MVLAALVFVLATQLAAVGWMLLAIRTEITAVRAIVALMGLFGDLAIVSSFRTTYYGDAGSLLTVLEAIFVSIALVALPALIFQVLGMAGIFRALRHGKRSGARHKRILMLAALLMLICCLLAILPAGSTDVGYSVSLLILSLASVIGCLWLSYRLLAAVEDTLSLFRRISVVHNLLSR